MPRRTTVTLAVIALAVLAGCLAADDDPTAGASTSQAEASPTFREPTNLSGSGAEPVVDVASDGTIFLQALGGGNSVWRSTDDGRTWEDVTPPRLGDVASGDAFVAVGEDDTVYVANSFQGKLVVYRSTDEGDSWTLTGQPPVDPPMHRMWLVPQDGTLHLLYEKLLAAPGTPGPDEPVVYYTSSDDRGESWTPTRIVDSGTHYGSDLAVGPEGRLYKVRLDDQWSEDEPPTDAAGDGPDDGRGECAAESGWYLRTSPGGEEWETHDMFGTGGTGCSQLTSGWQSLETDSEGTVYFLWGWEEPDDTSRVHLSVSHDQGRTWSTPTPLFPEEGAQVLPWFEVREPGELGVVWYAADEQGSSEEMDTEWYVDYGYVTDAATEEPSARVTRVTPYPVHHGNICTEGLQCSGEEDRSLLDFTWLTFGPDERAHLAVATTEGGGTTPVHAVEAEPFTPPADR